MEVKKRMDENQIEEIDTDGIMDKFKNIINKLKYKCKQNFIEKILFLILIVLIVLTTGILSSLKNKDTSWEYYVVYLDAEEIEEYTDSDINSKKADLSGGMINKYGKEGWELVDTYLEMETVHPNYSSNDYVIGLQSNVRPQRLVMIFKRPLVESKDNIE